MINENLRDARNIKSPSIRRQHVTSWEAAEAILRPFETVPPGGLIVYCGQVDNPPIFVNQVIQPEVPVQVSIIGAYERFMV